MTAVAKLPEISTFIEQMDMLRDDFVKYQDGNKSVPFVVLRDALVAALNAYDDARASLSPAELGGVEATVCVDAKPGFRHVIDVPPNVSLPVGTKLFTRKESS